MSRALQSAKPRSRCSRFPALVAVMVVAVWAALQAGARQDGAQPTAAPSQDGSSGQPAGAPGQGAGSPDAAAQPPVFRTGINFVRVDVIVTDRQGNPVGNLKREDFDVTEDGKPQNIETFRLIQLTGNPAPGEVARPIRNDDDEETEASKDDTRIFVFLLDDYHVRRGGGMVARDPLLNFLKSLGPNDLVGVMYPLTPVTALRLTRNHGAVMRVIEKFEGRKFDYRPRNEFEERYSMAPVEVVERIRNQVSLSAMEGLAVRLGGLREGRKAMIVLSEGYSNYVPPQLRDPVAEFPGMGNPVSRRQAPVNPVMEDRAQFLGNADLSMDMREVYSAANRNNTAIYTVDPRGLATFEYDINEGVNMQIDRNVLAATTDTLRALAEETDGRAIVNRNDLEAGMKQIIRDSSAYYLIGYNSTLAPSDGKFHEIKVRSKRPGVQIRARKGYWALTPQEAKRATAPPKPPVDPGVSKALAAVTPPPSRSQVVRTWVGTGQGDNGSTRITLVWEPIPVVPGSERRTPPSRVSVVAAGGDGTAYYRGAVEGGDQNTRRGGKAVFEAPPGAMQVRIVVEDNEGRPMDSDVLDVQVPDYTIPELKLSTLAVHTIRTARDLQALNADAEAVPVATREFRRTERLIVRFEVTAPGDAPPPVTAQLLNRTGQSMAKLPIQSVPNLANRSQVDLPLAGLPPGEYVVEIVAGSGAAETKQLLGFRVSS